jgi:hypothetical protein
VGCRGIHRCMYQPKISSVQDNGSKGRQMSGPHII